MTITQELEKFFDANPDHPKESNKLYSAYRVKSYTYNQTQNQHKLTVVAKDPNSRNQNNYQLERKGSLHRDLIKCLQEREEIVYFWTGSKLDASDLFYFEGGGYHWTIIPKKYLTEKQNAQEYINKNYPHEQRKNLEKLSIVGIKEVGWQLLAGKLDLSDFVNLKELYCPDNQLTSLNIDNCSQLEKLDCSNNKLTDIDQLLLFKLNPEKLKEIDLSNNKFSNDLKPFSRFVNLESLAISNNNFTGSLEPLKNLSKLKELNVVNTNINGDLQHLPNNLEQFQCYDPDYERNSFKSTELYKKELHGFNGNLKTWKEFFNSPVREWLDMEYPEDEEDSEESLGLDLLDEEKVSFKNRKEIIELDISNKNLEGSLKLKGFTNLKLLNCSNNQLTNLDLSDCPNLIELDVSNNEFRDLEFLKSVAKLKKLSVANSQKLSPQDLRELRILLSLKNLKELNINNCSFKGSLKILENLKNLEWLNISNTNISEGLEFLPKSCEILYCNSDYQYKSTKIMEELDKSNCWEERGNHKYYVPAKWREFKEDGLVVSVIPLERLFVIRNNIKRFIKKWGHGEEIAGQGKEELSELSKLQSPQEFNKYWYTGGIKWLARAGATAGGILALNDNPTLGGIFAATFPLIEVVASRVEEKFYDAKEKKWEEFVEDAKNFLDNYHELVGILKTIQIGELGKVNCALEDLDNKVNEFVKQYDNDQNESIDISELKEFKNRKKLGQDLNKEKPEGGGSQLGDIILNMKKLEEEVIAYRQGRRDKKFEEQTNENNRLYFLVDVVSSSQEFSENENQMENISDSNSSSPILNKEKINKGKKASLGGKNFWFTNLTKQKKTTVQSKINESYELQSQEQVAQTLHVPPYGVPSSSKK